MSARLKQRCKGSCGKRKNLKFDPEGRLCTDCLLKWRDEIITLHKNGGMSFEVCFERVKKRCRMSDYDTLEIIFPPLDDSIDLQHGGLELKFDLDKIRQQEEQE